MLAKHGIKSKPITVLNPAGNSICEHMHQNMGNKLRALLHQQPPQNVRAEVEDLIELVVSYPSRGKRREEKWDVPTRVQNKQEREGKQKGMSPPGYK